MEPEGSSPYTQEPATCPYPEPDQSSLRPHTQPLEDPLQYYSPIYAWVFQVVSFTQKVVTLPHQYSQFSERRYTHSTKINRFLNKGRHLYATLRGSYNTGPFPVTLPFAISPTFYIASILSFQKDERSLPGNLQSR
jgi:hypothetical protein